MPARGQGIRQHASHARLIGHPRPAHAAAAVRPRLDAIVVPASRPAHNLEHAITLARATQCHLVILCSRDARPGEILALLAVR